MEKEDIKRVYQFLLENEPEFAQFIEMNRERTTEEIARIYDIKEVTCTRNSI